MSVSFSAAGSNAPAPSVTRTADGSQAGEVLPDRLASIKDRFERCRARFDTAAARIEFANRLASMGWADQAANEATAALEMLTALGSELSDHNPVAATDPADGVPDVSVLTPREREILALLAEGLTNRQIGRRLTVSEHTAHHHVSGVLRKLGLRSRAAAAATYAATSRRVESAAVFG